MLPEVGEGREREDEPRDVLGKLCCDAMYKLCSTTRRTWRNDAIEKVWRLASGTVTNPGIPRVDAEIPGAELTNPRIPRVDPETELTNHGIPRVDPESPGAELTNPWPRMIARADLVEGGKASMQLSPSGGRGVSAAEGGGRGRGARGGQSRSSREDKNADRARAYRGEVGGGGRRGSGCGVGWGGIGERRGVRWRG